MAGTVHIDWGLDGHTLVNQGGFIVGHTRKALVTGLTPATALEVQVEALNALTNAGYSSQSTLTPAGQIGDPLVLCERNCRTLDVDKVEVELVYKHFSDNEWQDLALPPAGVLGYTVDTSLADKKSQVDAAGTALQVAYTYPATDATYPNAEHTIGGEIDVRMPAKTVRISGVRDLANLKNSTGGLMQAYDFADGLLNHINSAVWLGGAEKTWLCTLANYRAMKIEAVTYTYRFDFTFEYNRDGWQPRVVFKHEVTDKIPSDWKTNGVGAVASYQDVTWYASQDFNTYFSNYGVKLPGEF